MNELFLRVAEKISGRMLHIDKKSAIKNRRDLRKKGIPAAMPSFIGREDLLFAVRFNYERDIHQFRPMRRVGISWLGEFYKSILMWQAKKYFEYFYYLYKTQPVKLVVVWNGNRMILACATILAKKMGINTLFFENGLLPHTLTCDEEGVNFYSSLRGKEAEFYRSQKVDPEKMRRLRKMKWETRAPRIKKKTFAKKLPELPEKYLFLPFQVHLDSQVLIHSDVKSMNLLTEKTIAALKEYRKRTGEKLFLVTKEHPSDIGKVNYRPLYKLFKKAPALFLESGSTQELIEKSRAVVTLNSSVGLEALFCFKPVITLGRAFYNIPGLVWHLQEGDDFSRVIEAALNTKPDEELILKFFYYLRYRYLLDVDLKKPSLATADIEKVANRVLSVIKKGNYGEF